jgi:ABC-type dipeptide/oligopeptide/nickel transport system permease component
MRGDYRQRSTAVQYSTALVQGRCRGLREAVVMRRHALRAALPPVLGLVSVSVALMVTNVILIETAFNLPGFFRQAHVGR